MKSTKQLVYIGLFAALTCVATISIQLPTPTGGYVHLGDGVVILSGILLGPAVGGLAAGIGSMLADILTGYFVFAPATLIIKGLAAIVSGFLYQKAAQHLHRQLNIIISSAAAGVIVTGGYFIFEIFLKGFAIAVTGILSNILQGVSGLILASILIPIFLKIPDFKTFRNV